MTKSMPNNVFSNFMYKSFTKHILKNVKIIKKTLQKSTTQKYVKRRFLKESCDICAVLSNRFEQTVTIACINQRSKEIFLKDFTE